jgi:hypothetical protein
MRGKAQIVFCNRRRERGVTIILVVFGMAFLILAIAALAIDIVALYTASGQAKHVASASALAGAKVLANSGVTSDTNILLLPPTAPAPTQATNVVIAVATQSKIGGIPITAGQVNVTFPNAGTPGGAINPRVSVTVTPTNVPTFFARAWGTKFEPIGSTAVAEALNPSGSGALTSSGNPVPVAPQCVKPWVLPNLDPNHAGQKFFDTTSGALSTTSGQVGQLVTLQPACPGPKCTTPAAGYYFYAQLTPPLASAVPACTVSSCAYEENITACSPQPISCGTASALSVVAVDHPTNSCGVSKPAQTYDGTACLIHASNQGLNQGQDCLNVDAALNCAATTTSTLPAQMFAGSNNTLVLDGLGPAQGDVITASDSLVTIPVIDDTVALTGDPATATVIGFIQAFITDAGPPSGPTGGTIHVRIVNIAGCGTSATGNPVLGDGISPVPVRLISAP